MQGGEENMTDKQEIVCSDCAYPFVSPEERCPHCGSLNKTINISLDVPISPKVMVTGKVKDKDHPSKKNPRVEFMTGDELRKIDNTWIKKQRHIDKDRDEYLEKVVDPETGEIIHECHEPLSQHKGHGLAKKEIAKQKDAKK
jgi:hypothetical protein